MPTNAILTRAKRFMERNRAKAQKQLDKIDQQIAALQADRQELVKFLSWCDTPPSQQQPPLTVVPTVTAPPPAPTAPRVAAQRPPAPPTNALDAMEEQPFGPLFERGIAVAKVLATRTEFGANELYDLIKVNMPQASKTTAYSWIATWKGKSWLDTISPGTYKFRQCFHQQNP